jgi:small-conductance mechanosensitive channel
MTESLADEKTFSELERSINTETGRIAARWEETKQLLEDKPRRLALDSLAGSWNAECEELQGENEQIGKRAQRRDADIEALGKMRDSWAKSLDLAVKAEAPSWVVERARGTVAAIDATRPKVEHRRARVLLLQDSVSRALQSCDDALAKIRDARREAVERIFQSHELPVWELGERNLDARKNLQSLENEASISLDSLRVYYRTYRTQIALMGAALLLFVLLFYRARAHADRWSAADAFFASSAAVFRTPIAAALLVAVVFTKPLRPNPPGALVQILLGLAMLAAVRVMVPLLSAPGVAYGFAALFLVQLASDPLIKTPALDQIVSILNMAATAALLLWAAARLPAEERLASRWPHVRTLGPPVLRLLAAGCVVATVAAAVGYVDLARFLGGGALFLLYTAFALLAFRIAADGVLAIALVEGPMARLNAVARHRALVERRIGRAFDLLAVLMWIVLALQRFELLSPVTAALQAVLTSRFTVGDLNLDLGRLLGFAAVVVGAYLTTRIVVFALEEDVYSRMELPRGVPYALSSLTRYALLLTGFLLALGTLGLDLTKITVLVSAFGIGIGFGLQQIISNFVSGLILLFERPVQVGDSVQLGDLNGVVERIGIRSSTVRTPEGAEVIVPNSKMIEDKVTNWTLTDRRRRVDLDIVGVKTEGSEKILALLVEVARRDARVSAHPAPEALLIKFGEDAADYELRVWTEDPAWTRLRSDLGVAIQRALRLARAETAAAADPVEPGAQVGHN